MSAWETVVGLEVHVQLATRSKLFCGCAVGFGAPPNTNVCPVCLGLPGSLPVLNEQAVRLGVRAALALGGTVHRLSVFARKNYFYPDLPKGYQITQFDQPLATGGSVRFDSPDRGSMAGRITRLHLEEDAGKSLHDRVPGKTAIDLNRAGVPLAEIVTEPDLRSGAEARGLLTVLRQMLVFAGVSECSMETGSLRVDANISLRPRGESVLGTKTEVKNMNSFANVERAIDAERQRQQDLLAAGERIEQVTLLFDAAAGTVRPMRSKEASHDYRYFPDPDLPPLRLTADLLAAETRALPELPEAMRARFTSQYDLPPYDVGVLTAEQRVAKYFEAVVGAGADPKQAANWVMGDAMAGFKETGAFLVDPLRLAGLVELVAAGTVSHQAAKRVFCELKTGIDRPAEVAARLGLVQVRDASSLEGWVAEVVAAHPEEVRRYRQGEEKLLAFLVGQVMKRSKGKADPNRVNELLMRTLK